MDNLTIRKLRIEDVDSVGRIQESITRAPVSPDFKQIVLEHVPKAEEASFVAEVEGKVVGYMITYILSGSFGMDKNAWIAQFGVDPKYMGQGIGKSLAEEVFRFYRHRGINNIFTSVRWDSTDLLSFFKTLGFDRSCFINLKKVLE